MSRLDELHKIFDAFDEDMKILLNPLLDDAIFYEEHLEELKKLPHISVNPNNPAQQKSTPAAKLCKEYTQQYINIIKVLLTAFNRNGTEEDSPLRDYFNSLKKGMI